MSSERKPASVVVEGLEKTADKIRALAREGYLRTEIAELLDIRYQHARKVMLDAGILVGLSRGGTPPSATPGRLRKVIVPEPTPIGVLVEAGFIKLGDWISDEKGRIALSVPAPHDPGVYAFATEGFVRYIGLTRVGFAKRMQNYRAGHVRQRTSHRINAVILEHIGAGTEVEIYLAMPPTTTWNGLPVTTAAGLEAGLIELIQPPWNMMGVGQKKG
ncbi:GIY-YIG nuclease family protein [Pelagibacterium flavum]|uniref:GIY-YIG nuclease family protein n=1 Tax=Pelagibacterium flavum TaxID=2984530 RepID=A0ABY6ILB4_9HYPH|nr:GIY-YIG nuclease family protein [Pelagibacterium sp. YIM 151497]UYQ71129.1 GIY-YIG nuclease family protein [Pelagibacterium sp. YIM 151497]